MSAPQTNIETQKKRHAPSIFGIKGALVLAGILFVAVAIWSAMQGDDPEGAAIQIDGPTGQETVVTE